MRSAGFAAELQPKAFANYPFCPQDVETVVGFMGEFKKITGAAMDIKGKITGIKYKAFLAEGLQLIDIGNFNINNVSPYCVLKDGDNSFAVSKWVSPKRTRSYPYGRVYNTLNVSKKSP